MMMLATLRAARYSAGTLVARPLGGLQLRGLAESEIRPHAGSASAEAEMFSLRADKGQCLPNWQAAETVALTIETASRLIASVLEKGSSPFRVGRCQ
jgi:hypothetical protein